MSSQNLFKPLLILAATIVACFALLAGYSTVASNSSLIFQCSKLHHKLNSDGVHPANVSEKVVSDCNAILPHRRA